MDEDLQLLQQYARAQDEGAFQALVERHAPLVRGVALRRTRNPELADEITNSVFVLLARKAESVRESVGGWLYKTASLECGNALRKARLYQRKVEELRMQTPHSASDGGEASWDEVSLRLDEAMSLLESGSRALLILRFYEQKSFKEIAAILGKSEEASRKLISRSLQRLSERLRKKGVATSSSGLAALLMANSLGSPVASAAAIAAHAIKAASLAHPSVVASLLQRAADSPFAKTAGVALLAAAIPTGYFWRKNHALQEEVISLRNSYQQLAAIPAPPVMGLPREDVAATPAPPAENTPAREDFFKLGPGHSAREATRELTRISISLPDLSPEQKDRIHSLFETRKTAQTELFMKALQSGALLRNATEPEHLTAEDTILLEGLRKSDLDEDDPLKGILTESQFAHYLQAKEGRRTSAAEGTASDSLKALGQLFDLSSEQKDAIFQSIAQFELATLKELGTEIPFGDTYRETGRQKIIREHLSSEQAAIYDEKVSEDNERRRQFIIMLSDKQAGEEH